MWTICRKELADHFSSIRFLILFCFIFMVALWTSESFSCQWRWKGE
ncbi:MAG: hypothetical protein AAB676_07535 [Verrucomicrobiota bacterium]